MAWTVDARIPVRFGSPGDAGPDDAVLVEGEAPVAGKAVARFRLAAPEHGPGPDIGCACCAVHSPVGLALAALFQARAKGTVPFFRQVLALTQGADGEMAVWAAVRTDPLVSGRFRIG